MRPFNDEETRTFINVISFDQDGTAYIRAMPIGIYPADMALTRVVVRDQNNAEHVVTVPTHVKDRVPHQALFEAKPPPRAAFFVHPTDCADCSSAAPDASSSKSVSDVADNAPPEIAVLK